MSLQAKVHLKLNQKEKVVQNKNHQKQEFLLDCNSQNIKLPSYNAFQDKYLHSFLQSLNNKKHLMNMKLLKEKGGYYSEREYSILMNQSPRKDFTIDVNDLKHSKFVKYQQHKLPKLPRIVQKIQWIKDKLNTTKDSKLDTFLKPINKEEFKKFISLYKKE